MFKVFAPAKLNLALHVVGQREDGYHLLDSLVVFLDIGDQIVAIAAQETVLNVEGPFSDGIPTNGSNLVVRAAQLARFPMSLTLVKNLPPSSGIGGGSADAAATLRAAMRLGARAVSPAQALTLGADVPVCLSSKSVRMQGVGDVISPAQLPALHLVLVNPRIEVPTPEVFGRLSIKTNAPMQAALPTWKTSGELIDWLTVQRNDLETPAVQIAPEIAACLSALEASPKVRLVRMSGSGATCFAIYANRADAEAAARHLASANPWWWVKAASTLPS